MHWENKIIFAYKWNVCTDAIIFILSDETFKRVIPELINCVACYIKKREQQFAIWPPNLNGTNKKNDYESYLSAVRCSYLELDFLFRYYFPYQSDIFHLSLCSSGLPIQGVFTERYVRS